MFCIRSLARPCCLEKHSNAEKLFSLPSRKIFAFLFNKYLIFILSLHFPQKKKKKEKRRKIVQKKSIDFKRFLEKKKRMAESIPIPEPLIRLLVEYLVPTIKKQVSYLCCYSCNVQGLAEEIPKLNIRKESVQQDVDAAKDNLGVIRPEVVSWLKEVEDLHRKSTTISRDAEEVKKSCLSKWYPPLHYRLSRQALKTTEASIKLRDTRIERIANPVNPADLPPIPATSVIGFESRDSIENEIMDALKDKSVYLIGICGMGGIGKTTMAKKIEIRARENTEDSRPMFEKVIMVVVSQQLDRPKVQKEIAKGLGLRDLEEESLMIRARQLHARLKNAESVLIILDDVWEKLDLEELGIPSQSPHAGCKLMVTSRNRNALTPMEDAKIFPLGVLNDEESWILFRKSAGDSIVSPDLRQIAKDVVNKCNGLPLALVTVGSALRGRRKCSWEVALQDLQQPIPENIPVVYEDVYPLLLWSYKQLKREEHRYLFLLCCLFPEDSNISLEALVRFGWGLGIFDGIENLRQMRNKVESTVENLIDRSLLMESSDWEGDSCVEMHDVIRDMGIWIASEGKHVFMVSHGKNEWPKQKEGSYGHYTCISLIFSKGNIGVPECIECSRLELLRVDFPKASQILPDKFFRGMTRLKVLNVSGIKSMPSSIHSLNNLQTLYLDNCKLDMISIIGDLINLEILSLIRSDLGVLPEEIGRLRKLRKLEIIRCENLRSIAFGVLSRLVQLEELVIRQSFRNWEAEEKDKEMENASLAEFDSLSQLATLHIEISDPNAIPEKMPHWLHKLTKYSIIALENFESSWYDLDSQLYASENKKVIVFRSNNATPLRDWFCDMAGDVDCLDLEGPICTNVVNRLVRSGYQSSKYLLLSKCTGIQYLQQEQRGAIFPILKGLRVRDSRSLQEISNGPLPAGSFEALKEIRFEELSGLVRMWTFSSEKLCLSNLKDITISNCRSLLHLFPLSIAESLLQLEKLEVSNCQVMEEIFKREEGGMEITINKIKFPKLGSLSLVNLPNLCGFCKGIDRIEVPALRCLRIGNLRSIMREGGHDSHQQLFYDQQGAGNSFELTPLRMLFNMSRLRTLEVESINNFKSLFSTSIVSGLTNLEKLTIKDCSTLEEVIGKEENVEEAKTKRTLFPQLRGLTLSRLPKILAFCHSMGDLEFPSLQDLKIDDCPMMETFVQGISKHVTQPLFSKEVSCPKLKELRLNNLNTAGIFSHDFPIDNFCGLEDLTISSCNKMSNLFSLPIFRGLANIRSLSLLILEELQEVIAKEDDQEGPTNIKETLSPQLNFFFLSSLPKMRRFCHMNNDLEWPSLDEVHIYDCPMLEIFSPGPLHLPSFKQLYGLLDHDFAAKFFFKKEKSSDEIHTENNCFTLSARDLSITADKEDGLDWLLARDSSDRFVTAAKPTFHRSLEIRGKFEIEKLLPGVVYEIILMVMLDKYARGWEEAVDLKLTLPEGSAQHRTEILDEKPREEWIEMLVGEFTRKSHQIGQLEFSLSADSHVLKYGPIIGDVRIRVKG